MPKYHKETKTIYQGKEMWVQVETSVHFSRPGYWSARADIKKAGWLWLPLWARYGRRALKGPRYPSAALKRQNGRFLAKWRVLPTCLFLLAAPRHCSGGHFVAEAWPAGRTRQPTCVGPGWRSRTGPQGIGRGPQAPFLYFTWLLHKTHTEFICTNKSHREIN